MSSLSEHVPIYFAWDGGDFHFDAVLNEQHNIDSQVTEHAVEEGSNIADHVRPNPITVQIKGLITNTPVNRDSDFDRIAQVLQLYADTQAAPTAPDPPGAPPPVASYRAPQQQFALPLAVSIGDGSGG